MGGDEGELSDILRRNEPKEAGKAPGRLHFNLKEVCPRLERRIRCTSKFPSIVERSPERKSLENNFPVE